MKIGQKYFSVMKASLIYLEMMEKENYEFKPVKLRLKIDLVSYPGGVGKYDKGVFIHGFFFFFLYLMLLLCKETLLFST